MMRVVQHGDGGDEGGDVPLWADGAADFKDFCSNYRSQAKVRGWGGMCTNSRITIKILE